MLSKCINTLPPHTQELLRHMLNAWLGSGPLQNGVAAAVFCYQWSWYPFCSSTSFWLEHLIHVNGHLPLLLLLHSKDFVGPEKQRGNRSHKPCSPSWGNSGQKESRILGMWAVFASPSTHWLCQYRHVHLTTNSTWPQSHFLDQALRA